MVGDRSGLRGGPRVDMALLATIVAITALGVANLYSAVSTYVSTKPMLADSHISQIYWIGAGIAVGAGIAAVDYRSFERFAYVLWAGGIASLGLVLAFAPEVRGSRRWIPLGGFTFQPSEFMKILVVLALAKWLHEDSKTEPRTAVDLIPPLFLMAVPVIAVMAQPDLGTSLIYVVCAGAMLAMTRIHRWTLASGAVALALFLPAAWTWLLRDYQRDRITSFLDPERFKKGEGWHAWQSRTAIGNGGLTGEGFLQGTQNQFGYLPDQFSDFPFAVFAEEWGLLGSMVLLGLYAFLCIWSIHVASQAKDRFGAAVSVGVGAMVFAHVVFNVGMAVGLLPVVGVTLPLFSYGGSSALTMFVGFGLLMSVSMRR